MFKFAGRLCAAEAATSGLPVRCALRPGDERMTQEPPDADSVRRGGTPANTRSHILKTAFALVDQIALPDLTLRPLAERASVSVATLNHHFGNKQAVLDALIGASVEHEAKFVHRWEQTLGALPIADPDTRARLAGPVFEDWLTHNRMPLLVMLDLLHSPELTIDGPEALRRWAAFAGPFWSILLFGNTDKAELALGYVIDEAAFALGAGAHPFYRALRQLCLETLVARTAAGRQANEARTRLFNALVAALEPAAIPPATDQLGPRSRAIVEAAASLLTSPAHQPITHRSVAQASGVSAATVVYRFGSTEDLIAAGIYGVIDQFRRGTTGKGSSSPLSVADLVRATGMVALASARLPTLWPHALDMRRRRGENVKPHLLVQAGTPQELAVDPIFRQVFSIAVFGSRRLAYALGGASDAEGGRMILNALLTPASDISPT